MPTKTPQAKKAVVTCCSQSHGAPIERVSTSRKTASVNIVMHTPQRIIRPASSRSNAFHLSWRWRCSISARKSAIEAGTLLELAHHLEQLDRVRPELGGELVLHRSRRLHEAALVDVLDHLDAD